MHREFWLENLGKGDHLEDPDVDGIILIKLHLQEVEQGTWSIDLARDRGSWRALVNKVMDLRVP